MKKFFVYAAILTAIGGWLFSQYWYYLPGIISDIVKPIGEHREVAWESGPAAADSDDRPPNIILIVADDLGFNDITYYGGGIANGTVPTPNIDAIAADGIHFTNGYAGNGTCAPSRAALLTGRFAPRSRSIAALNASSGGAILRDGRRPFGVPGAGVSSS